MQGVFVGEILPRALITSVGDEPHGVTLHAQMNQAPPFTCPLSDTTLTVSRTIVRQEGIKEPPSGLSLSSAPGWAAVVPVGMVKRPQDHNGIVDGVLTALSPHTPIATSHATACAVAAVYSALLDGWDLESAVDLAYFVAKRGETFGPKSPYLDVVTTLKNTVDRADDHPTEEPPPPKETLADEALRESTHVIWALTMAYVKRNAKEAIEAFLRHGESFGGLAALAGSICAAYDPESLPKEWILSIEPYLPTDLDSLVEGLLDIRTPGWRRPIFFYR